MQKTRRKKDQKSNQKAAAICSPRSWIYRESAWKQRRCPFRIRRTFARHSGNGLFAAAVYVWQPHAFRRKQNRQHQPALYPPDCQRQIEISGRVRSKAEKKVAYQDNTDRIEVERKFSLAKRKFGLGLLLTKREDTTKALIVLSIIAMNIDRLAAMLLRLIQFLLNFGLPYGLTENPWKYGLIEERLNNKTGKGKRLWSTVKNSKKKH